MKKTEYENNPKTCKHCNTYITFIQRRNVFCSSSCAASFNNTGRPKTDEQKAAISSGCKLYFSSLIKPEKQKKPVSVKTPKISYAKEKNKVTKPEKVIKPKKTPPVVLTTEEIQNILNLYTEYTKVYGPYLRSDGRITVGLNNGKKTINKQLARLRLEVSLQRKLTTDETVDHIDNDKTNDALENLQILSAVENAVKGARASGRYIRKDHNQICDICKIEFKLSKKRMTCGSIECKQQIRRISKNKRTEKVE